MISQNVPLRCLKAVFDASKSSSTMCLLVFKQFVFVLKLHVTLVALEFSAKVHVSQMAFNVHFADEFPTAQIAFKNFLAVFHFEHSEAINSMKSFMLGY
jgi:hypothetical protein